MLNLNLTTVISGSFEKFKPKIDALHEEFRDYGVTVLEPPQGWLWTPSMYESSDLYRPLPVERGLTPKEIEERFLAALSKSNFMYLYCEDGYVGPMSGFEIAHAAYDGTPIYASEQPDAMSFSEGDLEHMSFIKEVVVVASIPEIVRIERDRLQASS